MTKLRLAPELSLPDDAVTQRLAFVGRPGSGKSYMATKLAELLFDVGAQFVALDPVGIWYGVRADGKGKGINVPVFGGLHGDVPLESSAGAFIADLIVDRGLSCVLDVSQFATDADKARFAAAFAERFYFRKKAAPSAVLLFLEECQEFVPQNPQRGEEHMLHHFTRMAKLGRNFGIGIALITQRPQEVNKKVLNLTECLFAFQMTGVHERKAIRDWVSSKGADEDIVAILPTLKIGVAHVYSPQWLGVSQQAKAYEKRSADVSSTPTLGASARAESRPLDPSELANLTKAMAATIEKAKAEDPRELRKEILALKKQLATAPARTVEKAVADPRAIERAVAAAVAPYKEALKNVESWRKRLGTQTGIVQTGANAIATLNDALLAAVHVSEAERTEDARRVPPSDRGSSVRAVGQSSQAPARPIAPSRPAVEGEVRVGRTGQGILDALAFFESIGQERAPHAWIGGLVGVSVKTGSWGARLSELRTAGLVTDPVRGELALTEAGRARADASGAPRSLAALHQTWLTKQGATGRKMLEALIAAYPGTLTRDQVAEAAGVSSQTGSFGARLSELRSPGLIEDVSRGEVRAAKMLFPEGLD